MDLVVWWEEQDLNGGVEECGTRDKQKGERRRRQIAEAGQVPAPEKSGFVAVVCPLRWTSGPSGAGLGGGGLGFWGNREQASGQLGRASLGFYSGGTPGLD